MVQSFGSQISPYRVILFPVEETFFQSFHHFLLTFQIGIRFIINFIETNSHHLIRFIESGIYPVIHLPPQGTDLRVIRLPLTEHLASFQHQRRVCLCLSFSFSFIQAFSLVLSCQFLYLSLVMLVKSYIIVTNQMVPLLAR